MPHKVKGRGQKEPLPAKRSPLRGGSIVFLILPQFRELDLVGILDVFATANELLPLTKRYRIEVLSSAASGSTAGVYGLKFAETAHFAAFKGRIDTLVIPGGQGLRGTPPADVLTWLRRRAKTARRLGSTCTGAFLLAQAGLLDGRRAATHWAYAEELKARFPRVRVDSDPIWICDGNIYTSAGVTAGIDLGLALVEEDHGNKLALAVARSLVVFLRRPGNQAQFSVTLRKQTAERRPWRELQIWMLEHLRDDLSVAALARQMGMSDRNFQRVFTREMGQPPASYVEAIRLEAARRRLETSGQSLEEIADACGFGSADVMGRSFQRQLQTHPGEYRERFR